MAACTGARLGGRTHRHAVGRKRSRCESSRGGEAWEEEGGARGAKPADPERNTVVGESSRLMEGIARAIINSILRWEGTRLLRYTCTCQKAE